jgi:hypothetical protein
MSRKASKNHLVASELCLTDSKGVVRALITLDSIGSPMLQFCDSDGRPRLDLMLDRDGDPHLLMWSHKNECVLAIGFSSREQNTVMSMWAGNGGDLLTIGVDADGHYERRYTADIDSNRPSKPKGKRRKTPQKKS